MGSLLFIWCVWSSPSLPFLLGPLRSIVVVSLMSYRLVLKNYRKLKNETSIRRTYDNKVHIPKKHFERPQNRLGKLRSEKESMPSRLQYSKSQWEYLKDSWGLTILDVIQTSLVKAPFSIATTPRCRRGHYSFSWIALLSPWYMPYIAQC